MLRNDQIEALAVQMARPSGGRDSVLLLGTGIARKADLPDLGQIARQVFEDLLEQDPAMAELHLSDEARAIVESASDPKGDELVPAFLGYLRSLSRIERNSLLQWFYGSRPVPQSYQDLARVLKHRLFRLVITTSADTLLRDALERAGMQRRDDYRLVDLITTPHNDGYTLPDAEEAVEILRLHAALPTSELAPVLDSVSAALGKESRIVVMGYDLKSDALNRWLARSSGDLWWVSPGRPDADKLAPIAQGRDVSRIDGPGGDLSLFFGLLAKRAIPLARLLDRREPDEEADAVSETPRLKLKGAPADSERGERPIGPRSRPEHIAGGRLQRQSAPLVGRDVRPTVNLAAQKAPRPAAKGMRPQAESESRWEELPTPRSRPDSRRAAIGKAESPAIKGTAAEGEAARKAAAPVALKGQPQEGGLTPEKAPASAFVQRYADELPEQKIEQLAIKGAHSEDDERARLLRERLGQTRAVLGGLEQQRRVEGHPDAQLAVQIDYQWDLITQLEDQLRALPAARREIADLMGKIALSVVHAPSLRSFVRSQVQVVTKEYEALEPDQDLIVAAIGATALLAERLGEDIVDQNLVRALASFVPSAVTRRV